MRIEGDWERDGILIVRELFDAQRVSRLLDIAEKLIEQYHERNPIDGTAGSLDSTSLFQIHHPAFFSEGANMGADELREVLEAAACESVLALVRETCNTPDPLFSHTSIFFNPKEGRSPESLGHGLPGSSTCCGEWHRDAQYIHPDEEKEKDLVLHPEDVMGGQMMQIQCALLPSRHFEYVRGSHNRWDTDEELLIRKGGEKRENRFSDRMPGAANDLLNPGDALVFCPWVIHRGHYLVNEPRRSLMFTYSNGPRPTFPGVDGFTNQPWMLDKTYLEGLSPHATDVFKRFLGIYGPYIEAAQAEESGGSASEAVGAKL